MNTASSVGELVYLFQRTIVLWGDAASFIKAHIFRLVYVDMEAYASSYLFQTI